MQRRAVGHRRVDMISVWTIKYALRVSFKMSLLQSICMVVISARYIFKSLFFASTKLEYEMYLNWLSS